MVRAFWRNEENRTVLKTLPRKRWGWDTPQRSKFFLEMEAAACRYYELLDQLSDDDPDVRQAKEELDRIEARFSDNPAYRRLVEVASLVG